MLIGVPKEIRIHEYRVGMTPASVREACDRGHRVLVEHDAGAGIGATDDDYRQAGACIAETADVVFAEADMIVKVKEPQPLERARLRRDQVLFTYLHLAPDPAQCDDLQASEAVCLAYETVTQAGGGLPLLAPMSEVAGRMAIQVGAACLERPHGGMGILLGGVPGVAPARVVILGGGTVGLNAALMAVGAGAETVVVDRSLDVLRRIEARFGGRVVTRYADHDTIEHETRSADLLVCAALVPGAAAPRLVSRSMVASMKRGAVIVDVAIDQGGCCETSRPTTHADPTYLIDGVVHYCVANMPGGVPRTSATALNNATLPFVLALADKGWRRAIADDPHLRAGLNVALGRVTHPAVASALERSFSDPMTL